MKNIKTIADNIPIKIFLPTLFIIAVVLLGAYITLDFRNIKTSSVDYPVVSTACSFLDKSQQIECLFDRVKVILEERGVKDALENVAVLSKVNRDFNFSCHDFMHEIGKTAYFLFKDKKNFTITPDVTMCTYGFYHGFMETLIQATQDPTEARNFCAYVNRQLAQSGLNLASANFECFHGIGHGWVEVHYPSKFGKPLEVTKDALVLCEEAAENEEQFLSCSSGVFNGIANSYMAGAYEFKIDDKDPFWICKKQDDMVKSTCFGFMARNLLMLSKGDIASSLKLAKQTVDEEFLEEVVANVTVVFPGMNKYLDDQGVIQVCHTMDEGLRFPCLTGFVIGIFQTGIPGEEYKKALDFCNLYLLTPKEKNECISELIPHFKSTYTKEKLASICSRVDESHRKLCGID